MIGAPEERARDGIGPPEDVDAIYDRVLCANIKLGCSTQHVIATY
jgi:hypothetical protein